MIGTRVSSVLRPLMCARNLYPVIRLSFRCIYPKVFAFVTKSPREGGLHDHQRFLTTEVRLQTITKLKLTYICMITCTFDATTPHESLFERCLAELWLEKDKTLVSLLDLDCMEVEGARYKVQSCIGGLTRYLTCG